MAPSGAVPPPSVKVERVEVELGQSGSSNSAMKKAPLPASKAPAAAASVAAPPTPMTSEVEMNSRQSAENFDDFSRDDSEIVRTQAAARAEARRIMQEKAKPTVGDRVHAFLSKPFWQEEVEFSRYSLGAKKIKPAPIKKWVIAASTGLFLLILIIALAAGLSGNGEDASG